MENIPPSSSEQFIGVSTFAKMLGVSKNTVSVSARRAANDKYRGKFLKPDHWIDGHPCWSRKRAQKYCDEMLNK